MAESKIQKVISDSGTGYCKMPDRTLIQWGVSPITRNAGANYVTATFPISFIDIPVGFVNCVTGHPEIWMASIPVTTKTTIQCCLYNGGSAISSSSEIWWIAIGRWK